VKRGKQSFYGVTQQKKKIIEQRHLPEITVNNGIPSAKKKRFY